MDDLVNSFGLKSFVESKDIRFPGFVRDTVRDRSISSAICVVYLSLYEGFGLPILETLLLGTPVITSYSTSLPEVGGELAIYCDLASPEAFGSALSQCIQDRARPGRVSAGEARMTWAKSFSWQASYHVIRDAALQLM